MQKNNTRYLTPSIILRDLIANQYLNFEDGEFLIRRPDIGAIDDG